MTWQPVPDGRLHDAVLDRFRWAPEIDPRHIAVSVHDAVVTLSGTSESVAEKQAAARVAAALPGVRTVIDEVVVRSAAGHRGDGEIATAVQVALARHPALDRPCIDVRVHGQVVRLTGTVDGSDQRAAARHVAQAVLGVRAVVDELQLPPLPTPTSTKTRVLEQVGVGSVGAVDIRIDGRTATLEGNVPTWYDRRAVERAARSVPGVAKVENHLVVAR